MKPDIEKAQQEFLDMELPANNNEKPEYLDVLLNNTMHVRQYDYHPENAEQYTDNSIKESGIINILKAKLGFK